MTGASGDPVPIRDALAHVRSELGLPSPDALETLLTRWVDVVGSDVAAHVRLGALRDGTAVLTADSPLWASQVRYLETEIVDRANALVGDAVVQAVRVRIARS